LHKLIKFIKITAFWNTMPYTLAEKCQHFTGVTSQALVFHMAHSFNWNMEPAHSYVPVEHTTYQTTWQNISLGFNLKIHHPGNLKLYLLISHTSLTSHRNLDLQVWRASLSVGNISSVVFRSKVYFICVSATSIVSWRGTCMHNISKWSTSQNFGMSDWKQWKHYINFQIITARIVQIVIFQILIPCSYKGWHQQWRSIIFPHYATVSELKKAQCEE